MRLLTFKDAIREAQEIVLQNHPEAFIIGEGANDPKAVFGTCAGLKEKFPNQIFDMPVSENGMTGVCIGAAINGMRPILVHMRMDFALYSMDQLVNNAAKWFSMFGGLKNVPMVVRCLVGRGWGGGNQHTQNLTAMFASVPGLKVLYPSNAYDAKAALISAVEDPNPVILVEHRWLYDTTSDVPEGPLRLPIGQAKFISRGDDITVVAWGHAMKEARRAVEHLKIQGSSIDLIDPITISPMDMDSIYDSVLRTKNLLVVDDAWKRGSVANDIVADVSEHLSCFTARLTCPNYPAASSPHLTKGYYPDAWMIGVECNRLLEASFDLNALILSEPDDVPDKNFRGPF